MKCPKDGADLGPDRNAVGVGNVCTECRRRVCIRCGNYDADESWMSGHCYACQNIVANEALRRDRAARADMSRKAHAGERLVAALDALCTNTTHEIDAADAVIAADVRDALDRYRREVLDA